MYGIDLYLKIIISSYMLLGLTFNLANLILNDELLEIKNETNCLFGKILIIIFYTYFFPLTFFLKNSYNTTLFEINENEKLEHREFLSIWLNLILICIIYILLKLYVI